MTTNFAVIMAGGSGQRLWPLSRKSKPKQILDLFGQRSLLQIAVDRIRGIFEPANILVVTNANYVPTIREHLPELPPENIIGEPAGRNTANAVGLAAAVLNRRNPNGIMAVFSADQLIDPVEPLQEAIKLAIRFLHHYPGALFTFGIKATFAHTGLGYLKRGQEADVPGVYKVEAFREKPNRSTAGKYLRSGDYCWNSGMFVWRVDTIIRQLEEFLPHNANRLSHIVQAWGTPEQDQVLASEFPQLESISIDYGVMEKASDVYMCELSCEWKDVGSFETLAETVCQPDHDNNRHSTGGHYEFLESSNNIVLCDDPKHLVATIGIQDLIVVHCKDITLICRRDEADYVRKILATLEEKGQTHFL